MAAVIPLGPRIRAREFQAALDQAAADRGWLPGTVLSLRERLFERAVDEAIAQRMADELRNGHAQSGPRRLRVVRP